ncbi:peptidase M76 family-domain-containing protein [Haematococcus lacustris]
MELAYGCCYCYLLLNRGKTYEKTTSRKTDTQEMASEGLGRAAIEAQLESEVLTCKRVQTLMRAMRQLGCPVDRQYFNVVDCKMQAGGGYSPTHGVVLCQDELRTKEQVHSTVLHELVHAYDDCRAGPGGLDWTNCRQHACTEVRAARLSGDCDWSQEAWRGQVSLARPTTWPGFQQRCIARRAALSLALSPCCKDIAAASVQEVMASCLADLAPFQTTEESASLPPNLQQQQQEQQQQQQQQEAARPPPQPHVSSPTQPG